jgi:two-component system, NtrC family, nitrogen regulation sensor histidine kinase NtrY
VPCDRRLMRQALTNLLQNAADAVAMREGAGIIELAIRQDDDAVRISVTDDGVGLPADRVRLTEPYVTHKPKGTGLGLAIVKKIMEDHGGSLVLEDRSDGASVSPGAIATLVMPLARPGPRVAVDAGEGRPAGVLAGIEQAVRPGGPGQAPC